MRRNTPDQIRDLTRAVAQELQTDAFPEVTSFSQRRFSLFYGINAGGQDYFLKIRKQSSQSASDLQEIVTSESNRLPAQNEWEALKFFYSSTTGSHCPINFVTPVAYIGSLNGILTERVTGDDLWRILKRARWPGSRVLGQTFREIGRGLACMHTNTIHDERPLSSFLAGVDPIDHGPIDHKVQAVAARYTSQSAPVAYGMGGLDVRDIILSESRRLFIVDPTNIKEVFTYESIAGFIGTLRKLSRDSLLFPGRGTISMCESEFLRGYCECRPLDRQLLGVFQLEQFASSYRRSLRKARKRNVPVLPHIGSYYRRQAEKVLSIMDGNE